jgi:hypothetical protein
VYVDNQAYDAQEAYRKNLTRDALLSEWINGADVRLSYNNWGNWGIRGLEVKTTHLRLNGEEIETSLGARFPLSHGVKAIKLIQALRLQGAAYTHNGRSIHLGDYVLDSIAADGTIKAGCHTVTPEEFDRFTGLLAERGLL